MYSNNQSFFIEEVSQYDIIDESYSIMYKDMQNWHNLQLAIYECVLNEGNIINFIKDIIHKIIETLKKWWKNITDFIKKVINNIKSKLSGKVDITMIDVKRVDDLKISSRELILMVLHGKDYISHFNIQESNDDIIDSFMDSMDLKIDMNNNTEKIKEQIEKELSNIDKVKENLNENKMNVNDLMEEIFKDYKIEKTDDGQKLFDSTSFINVYKNVKGTIESGVKLLETQKKKVDSLISDATKRLNVMETMLTQMLKNNNDSNIDKLVKDFINNISSILQSMITGAFNVSISANSKILNKAATDLENVFNSLKKEK